jgi:dTDP-4-amino-4,6-dideoxygalactose transaminase
MSEERVLLSPPDVGALEEEYVVRALRSGWVAPTGPDVNLFEEEMAARVGIGHGVALSSGTAALHLAMLGVGVRPGDVVLVSSMTFAASANAVVYTGAQPCFVDSVGDGTIDPDLLTEAIRDQRRQGKRVAAVMAVDLLGRAADYDSVTKICEEHDVPLLEDAAEALGATYRGTPAGRFGRAAVLSFNGNKIMTTSGGGMLLTDDEELAERARFLSTQAREPALHYEHREVGYNYRLSNILAALGRAQLARLDEMVRRRREIRTTYAELAASLPGVTVFQGQDDAEDNCWLTALLIDPADAVIDAAALTTGLDARGIEARPLWKPMHAQPVFAEAPAYISGVSDDLFTRGVTLPSGSKHDAAAIELVCKAVHELLGGAS